MANNATVATIISNTTEFVPTLDKYLCSDKGLILPVINEFTWASGVRAFLYLAGLLWCFLAVAIVADIFMASIEKITSKVRTVRIADPDEEKGYKEVELKVWNDTVANLSLLALGTSAPEILLSVIEIVGGGFEAGELGPSTIVGSASFNLLFISAICIYAIPEDEIRRIASIKVFAVTAFTCVGAYVWMAIVLLVWTPNEVRIEEAIITFLMFPVLILVAYAAEKDFFMGKKAGPGGASEFVGIPMNTGKSVSYSTFGEDGECEKGESYTPHDKNRLEEIHRLAKELGREEGVSQDDAVRILTRKEVADAPHGKGWYRINACRGMSGGRKLLPVVNTAFMDVYDRIQTPEDERPKGDGLGAGSDFSEGGRKAVVQFTAAAVAVMENEGKVRVGIKRTGKLDEAVSVRVLTTNGTAVAGEDYKSFNQIVNFKAKEALQEVYIEIVDDCEWEPDEFFFVKLKLEDGSDGNAVLGSISICEITIINDDEPGVLQFAKPSFVVKETGLKALLPVVRLNGADGHVSVKWKTKDITAIEGKDYSGAEGELKFDNQETTKNIIIPLFESNKPERDESFQIELTETDGGATVGKIQKTIVTIVNDEEFNGLVSRIMNMTKANLDALELHKTSYMQQFIEAMNVNGGDLDTATFLDYLLHFATFFFKVCFAFIPPAQYLGGWPAFFVSLGAIGFLTAIIGDLAGIFGCLIGLDPSITAITLVALGTSMPDTFASKTAAVMEKTADSSIGNVNGSNSVNVFLGLGLPWLMASIYHLSNGSTFKVPAGSLGFSVVIYSICAIIAIGIFVVRRSIPSIGAELGGPKVAKIISALMFVFLWVFYILMSILNTTGVIDAGF